MPVEPAARPVPPGTLVLQIGPFKTGTTAIQHAASRRRTELAARGVVYPGTGLNHRWGCSALVGFTWGWSSRDAVAAEPRHGRALLKEIDRAPRNARVWLSYERLAVLDTERARDLCRELGHPHVVVGLRPLRSLLASEWQQLVKSGRLPGDLDGWAHKTMDAAAAGSATARHFDHAALVERWAGIVGADAVTCVVVDPRHRENLPRAMEGLLGLPSGLLELPGTGQGHLDNRALTAAELALVSAVARDLRGRGMTHEAYGELIAGGMIPRLLDRRPDPSELRIGLGPEAAARAAELDRAAAERVGAGGVRVLGGLDWYAGDGDRLPATGEAPAALPDLVPLEIASAAVLGSADRLRTLHTQQARTPLWRIARRRLGRRLRRLLGRLQAARRRVTRRSLPASQPGTG